VLWLKTHNPDGNSSDNYKCSFLFIDINGVQEAKREVSLICK